MLVETEKISNTWFDEYTHHATHTHTRAHSTGVETLETVGISIMEIKAGSKLQ